jgi:hypothetical protein
VTSLWSSLTDILGATVNGNTQNSEYVCTAGNDIVSRDGNVKQTGSGYVIINGMKNRQDLVM